MDKVFMDIWAFLTKMVPYPPPLVLSFVQAHLCDTPFCYIFRDNCAIPHTP